MNVMTMLSTSRFVSAAAAVRRRGTVRITRELHNDRQGQRIFLLLSSSTWDAAASSNTTMMTSTANEPVRNSLHRHGGFARSRFFSTILQDGDSSQERTDIENGVGGSTEAEQAGHEHNLQDIVSLSLHNDKISHNHSERRQSRPPPRHNNPQRHNGDQKWKQKHGGPEKQLIEKCLPVHKHLRRLIGIERDENHLRSRHEQQQQQKLNDGLDGLMKKTESRNRIMNPLFRIPVPVSSWVRVMGVLPITTLDEVVHSIESQLRQEAFFALTVNDEDDQDLQNDERYRRLRKLIKPCGIIDLDAQWNPVAEDPASVNIPNILDRLATPDGGDGSDYSFHDIESLFKVKSAHVILSPFGRPMGWDIELANPSMVYALLLKSRQARMIGDFNKRELVNLKRNRLWNSHNSSNDIEALTSHIKGSIIPFSFTIQDAIRDHLLWMKNKNIRRSDKFKNDDGISLPVLNNSEGPERIENHVNKEGDGGLVLEAKAEEIGSEKEEKDLAESNYDATSEESSDGDRIPINLNNMIDRRVRIGWKLVEVEELRRPHHRGQTCSDNSEVDDTGIVYNIDRFRNTDIPIVVDDSMVRFENCPRTMNSEQLRFMLSRYDLAEQPVSNGNSIMLWRQKTDDGKSHRMFIVRFADASWARAAIRELQATVIDGKVIRLVQFPKQIRSEDSGQGAKMTLLR